MPALSGQVISTLTDGTGSPIVVVTWFFNPTTFALRNNPADWTDPSGTVWPAGTGALIGANLLDFAVRMVIRDVDDGSVVRRVLLPASTGRAATAAQLRNAPAPDGPFEVAQDLNGLSFDISGAQFA